MDQPSPPRQIELSVHGRGRKMDICQIFVTCGVWSWPLCRLLVSSESFGD